MADNATLARRMYEAFNERNFDEIAEATAPEAGMAARRGSARAAADKWTAKDGGPRFVAGSSA